MRNEDEGRQGEKEYVIDYGQAMCVCGNVKSGRKTRRSWRGQERKQKVESKKSMG